MENLLKSVRLSENDRKGYDYEIKEVQAVLLKCGFSFLGNPTDIALWKQNIKRGVDIYISDYLCEIEERIVPLFNNVVPQ